MTNELPTPETRGPEFTAPGGPTAPAPPNWTPSSLSNSSLYSQPSSTWQAAPPPAYDQPPTSTPGSAWQPPSRPAPQPSAPPAPSSAFSPPSYSSQDAPDPYGAPAYPSHAAPPAYGAPVPPGNDAEAWDPAYHPYPATIPQKQRVSIGGIALTILGVGWTLSALGTALSAHSVAYAFGYLLIPLVIMGIGLRMLFRKRS